MSEAGAALRTLQLQQLALRRAGRAPPHVVLAHLAPPAPSAPSAPSAPAAPNTPPAPHTSPAPHTPQAPDNTQQ